MMLVASCSTPYKNQKLLDVQFPSVSGTSLAGKNWLIPKNMLGKKTIFLIGYKQDSQYDIDRWLIGLDMKGVTVSTFELPTIKGIFPRMFSTVIDSGMRRGIPKDLWKGVITIYKDGSKIQKFTGNEKPNNTRVILLDSKGIVRYFNDEGFSVSGLNELIKISSSI
jgi:hypothetical protein